MILRSALVLLLAVACTDGTTKKQRDQGCTKNLDCAYGLECVDGSPADAGGAAASADGGPPPDGGLDGGARSTAQGNAGRTCQFKSFGDCDGDQGPDGKPQCLAGQRCRDGRCTVQCAAGSDCGEGQSCRIGVCQRAAGAVGVCNDNRDCAWPQICYYGQCATRSGFARCRSDLDCNVQARCVNGVCQ